MKNSISNFVYPNEINLNENNEEYQISLSIDNRIVGDNKKEYDEKISPDLGIRSDIILIPTITKANFTTKPFDTKK